MDLDLDSSRQSSAAGAHSWPESGRSGRVRFLDLPEDRCAFIADDPASVPIDELLCCGLPVGPAGSLLGARYCLGHRAVVLVPRARQVAA